MKYELSQEAYLEFLNTLSRSQQDYLLETAGSVGTTVDASYTGYGPGITGTFPTITM